MIKVLLMSSPTSDSFEAFGVNKKIAGGGWAENLICKLKECDDLEISLFFYSDTAPDVRRAQFNGVTYYAVPIRVPGLRSCSDAMVEDMRKVLSLSNPDVVHIIGTEREHNLRMLELAGADRTVCSITGLTSICALHYFGGIDYSFMRRISIGDCLRRGGPIKERDLFAKWGVYEKKTIATARYIMGRTTWDYACVKKINPDVEYIYCGEVLNPCFYEKFWDVETKVRHQIFVSQASYPLKGFHMLLEALPYLLAKYSDCSVYVAGPNMMEANEFIGKIRQTTYSKYLIRRMKELDIPKQCIHFTGALDAMGMLQRYMSCNVFVLPSAIENSPNSLGEAMSLGVPCVASCVGGVQDMLRDKVDGFIYPFNEPYMMAYYIEQFFESDELCSQMGYHARENAAVRFNAREVVKTTLQVYRTIVKNRRC